MSIAQKTATTAQQQLPLTPSRCILLGPTGSGKTTFLYQIKQGTYRDVAPTADSNVEEIQITSTTSLVFTDISGAADRRTVRLHFLQSAQISDMSMLFFIDASAPPSQLRNVLSDMVYYITFAYRRSPTLLKYVGIVVNKQDMLLPEAIEKSKLKPTLALEPPGATDLADEANGDSVLEPMDRKAVVKKIMVDVREAMEIAAAATTSEGGNQLVWEILDGGKAGISAKTGKGVKMVFNAVVKAVYGSETLSPLTGEPIEYG